MNGSRRGAGRPPEAGWAAVVLAAGEARRFGTLKQVAPVAGRPMVVHPVQAAVEAGAARVWVVTGAGRASVEAALDPLRQRGLPVETVFNPRFAAGMAGSLRAGLAALGAGWPLAVILLADQPWVDAGLVAALVAAARASRAGAAGVRYPDGELGVPAAFGRELWPRLEALRGDQGARAVLRSLPGAAAVDPPAGAVADVDTPEAYRALVRGEPGERGSLRPGATLPAGREGRVVPVVCFVGASGSGKTTLVVRLVENLVGRGLQVATVKHASHGFDMDHPGKDSYRHFHAGAQATLVSSPGRYALVGRLREEAEAPLEELLALLPPVDLVLAEGFKSTGFPAVEVHRRGSGRPRIPRLAHRIAVVSDEPLEEGVPWFHPDAVETIADFVIRLTGVAGRGSREAPAGTPRGGLDDGAVHP